MENQSTPSPRSFVIQLDRQFVNYFLIFAVIGLAAFLLIKLLPSLSNVIITVVIAILITAILEPIVTLLENNGMNRIGAILLVFIGMGLLLVVAIFFSAPYISAQLEQLSNSIESQSITTNIDAAKKFIFQTFPFLDTPSVQKEVTNKLQKFVTEIMNASFAVGLAMLTSFLNIVIVALAVFFFLKDGWRIQRAIVDMMPNRYFEISLLLIHKITEQLGKYLRGQLLVSILVGTLSIIALSWLEIPYSFFIGAMAGLANVIPYFGPLLGLVLALAVALTEAPSLGAVMAIAGSFAAIQLIDNVLISPFIVSKSVELHPLAIIIVILIGSALLGIWGMLLAVPITSILKVTYRYLRWGVKNYRLKEKMYFEGAG